MHPLSKLDVFFCTCPQSEARRVLSETMLRMWRNIPCAKVHVLRPEAGREYEFQRERRIIAEKSADELVYVLTDDDIEPLFDLKEAVRTMMARPWFGIISALPSNATINRWTIEGYNVFEDSEVMEHIDVGGLRFVRKGSCPKFPPQERIGYDREHCIGVRKRGFRVGYFKNLHAIHHGEGASDIWGLPQKAFA